MSGIESRPNDKVLRRVLPDKLDWTHEAYLRLWMKPEPYPYGGGLPRVEQRTLNGRNIYVETTRTASKKGLVSGVGVSKSMSDLVSSHANAYYPPSTKSSRNLRDYYTYASTLNLRPPFDAPAPSSLAVPTRTATSSPFALGENPALLRGREAFLGKS
jgi:hypothetical protein